MQPPARALPLPPAWLPGEDLLQLFIHGSGATQQPRIICSRILTELAGAQPGQPMALGTKRRDFHIDL